MRRALFALACALSCALAVWPAWAANLTPPNLGAASGAADADLMLVWPSASAGPLESLSWAGLKAQLKTDLGSYWLLPANNLSDLTNVTAARTNLGLGSAATYNAGAANGQLPPLTIGTYTPTVTFSTPGDLSVAYSTQTARYTRIGDMVFVEFRVTFTPTFTTASGTLLISTPSGLTPVHSDSEAGTLYTMTVRDTRVPSVRASPTGMLIAVWTNGNSIALDTSYFTSGTPWTVAGSVWYRLD